MTRDPRLGRTTLGANPAAEPAAGPSSPSQQRRNLMSLAERYGVPAFDVAVAHFPLTNLDLIPSEIARNHVVLPVQVRDDALFLAMADPSERRIVDELEFVSGKRVFPYVGDREALVRAIDLAYRLRDQGETHFAGPRATHGGLPSSLQSAAATVQFHGSATPGAINPGASVAFKISDLPSSLSLDDELDGAFAVLSSPAINRADISRLANQKTVLVVDDEEDIRKLLRRVLEDAGYRVVEADRGSSALSAVKAEAPDAIVLDAMLPELHGFDICRRIKTSARYGHIPVMMISAVYRGWRIAEDLKSAYGVNAYIEKPFRLAEVLAEVERMIAGAPPADQRDAEALSAEAEGALGQAMNSYRGNDVDAAIRHIERGLALDPLAFRLHYHLALLMGRKGDVFRAIQALETAIELNPKSFPALKNLAVLYQQAGFKHKAIELWERALGQCPDDKTRTQIKDHLLSLL